MKPGSLTAAGLTLIFMPVVSPPLAAAPHEIKVFTDELADTGEHTLEIHANTAKAEPMSGASSSRAWRFMPEYSYGVALNWEASLQLPATLMGNALYGNGVRGELQYVAPHDTAGGIYWGINAEIAYSAPIAERSFWGIELAPIIGYRTRNWHFALNLGIELPLSGEQRKVTFEPAAMITYRVNSSNKIGVEYYLDLGPLKDFAPREKQSRMVYAVWNYDGDNFDVNLGIGRGITDSSDQWVFKTAIEFRYK